MTAQLPLALRWPRRQRFEYFHPGPNAATLSAVQALASETSSPWVYLHGPTGCGRTHLLMAACQASASRVQYLPLAKLDDPAVAIRGVVGVDLLALDDLGAIAGNRAAEHALFDLYNRACAEGRGMLFAADAAPSELGLELPDLRSRLAACTRFALKPLGDDERRMVLKSRAASRGIELEDAVLDWLFARYARDLGALLDLLDRLDVASLAAQRRITVRFLRVVLREAGEAGP